MAPPWHHVNTYTSFFFFSFLFFSKFEICFDLTVKGVSRCQASRASTLCICSPSSATRSWWHKVWVSSAASWPNKVRVVSGHEVPYEKHSTLKWNYLKLQNLSVVCILFCIRHYWPWLPSRGHQCDKVGYIWSSPPLHWPGGQQPPASLSPVATLLPMQLLRQNQTT